MITVLMEASFQKAAAQSGPDACLDMVGHGNGPFVLAKSD